MQSKIEQQVMAGVGMIYAARLLISRTAGEAYALALAALALWQLTWVHRVFSNFLSVSRGGPLSTEHYLVYAVEHTQLAVQLALFVVAVAGVALFADALRATRSPHLHRSLLLPR